MDTGAQGIRLGEAAASGATAITVKNTKVISKLNMVPLLTNHHKT